jgi:hypothetical protein
MYQGYLIVLNGVYKEGHSAHNREADCWQLNKKTEDSLAAANDYAHSLGYQPV